MSVCVVGEYWIDFPGSENPFKTAFSIKRNCFKEVSCDLFLSSYDRHVHSHALSEKPVLLFHSSETIPSVHEDRTSSWDWKRKRKPSVSVRICLGTCSKTLTHRAFETWNAAICTRGLFLLRACVCVHAGEMTHIVRGVKIAEVAISSASTTPDGHLYLLSLVIFFLLKSNQNLTLRSLLRRERSAVSLMWGTLNCKEEKSIFKKRLETWVYPHS